MRERKVKGRRLRSVERRGQVDVVRSEKPEAEIAFAKVLDQDDIEKYKMVNLNHVGRWAVINRAYVHLCHTYLEASKLASSLNRSPA